MSRIGRKRARAVAMSREIISVLDQQPELTQDRAREVVMASHQSLADYMDAWQRRIWAAFALPPSALVQKFSGLNDITSGATP